MKKLFTEFFRTEKAAGLVLIACTAVSLVLANSRFADSYVSIWGHTVLGSSLEHWINDGLMTFFFLLVGLEIEREIYTGELASFRKAILPIVAAIGGMIVPALIFYAINAGTDTQAGVGIPMATDIAFALGALSLLGRRVPLALKVFLAALAIIDDIGAVIVIGIYYSGGLSIVYMLLMLVVAAALALGNRLGVRSVYLYAVGGLLLWFFTYRSGVQATLAGVILAFLIPFDGGSESSPSYKLEHGLNFFVPFLVMPLFALANTAITLYPGWPSSLWQPLGLGIIVGLVAGKFVGISLSSLLAVKLKLCTLPQSLSWKHIFAVSILGGIGFTMSIFIAQLAFSDAALIVDAKIAILAASTIAGLLGYTVLQMVLRGETVAEEAEV